MVQNVVAGLVVVALIIMGVLAYAQMRGACTGARSKPSSPADQLALTCSASRDAAANLARFSAHAMQRYVRSWE